MGQAIVCRHENWAVRRTYVALETPGRKTTRVKSLEVQDDLTQRTRPARQSTTPAHGSSVLAKIALNANTNHVDTSVNGACLSPVATLKPNSVCVRFDANANFGAFDMFFNVHFLNSLEIDLFVLGEVVVGDLHSWIHWPLWWYIIPTRGKSHRTSTRPTQENARLEQIYKRCDTCDVTWAFECTGCPGNGNQVFQR